MRQQYNITLDGEWKLESADGKVVCPVQIPGSVLSAAVKQGILNDPYYRMNEYPAREFLRQDFVFSRTFSFQKQAGCAYELCCDGIDTIADIYLNGSKIRHADNMHLRYRIPCTGFLADGDNELRICFTSALRYIEEYEPQQGKEIHYTACGAVERNQYIRKAHSMFGWDWGPQLPDLGIWRTVFIRGTQTACLSDVKILQKHQHGQVELIVEPKIKIRENGGEPGLSRELSMEEAKEKIPDAGLELQVELISPQGETVPFTEERCLVAQPQLWWPNRYGKQPLYTVKAALMAGGELLDEKQYRIGLRTLTVSREKDAWGEEFAFCVNGVKIFAKGADYIPEDCMYTEITPKRVHSLLDAAVECGFNCIRVWGGGYYPSDMFYDYCDEKGLIVWQDFMYACNIYELTDQFRQNIIAETKDNARRLRHHASLGLWCGNNEMESAWNGWEGFCNHTKALQQDYLTMFEEVIPQALRAEDETVFYWPSSPSSGGGFRDPDSDDAGDRHYWDVWHGEKPFSDYGNYYFRFCSEFGFQSFPCMKTIASFTLPQDRNIFTEVMESHQKNGSANGKIMRYISDYFLYPKDFKSLVYISQVLQGIAVKEGVEHWRQNRGRCMGAVYWQLNDNWPVASWSSVDYFGRWKALQYMARHFYADLLGGLQTAQDGTYIPFVQNETMRDAQSQVCLYVKDMAGTVLYEKKGRIACRALSVAYMKEAAAPSGRSSAAPCSGFDLSGMIRGREDRVFVEAVFRHSDGTVSRQVRMPRPYKHMKIGTPHITCESVCKGGLLELTLKTDVPAFFVAIETDADLPLSDNFMHLTGPEEYKVTGKLPDGSAGIPQVRIYSLRDSYAF